MQKKLLIMAGGTGGHVFPGLAVAKKLQAQGWEVRWLGTKDRMEADLVPASGIEIDFIEISGIKGKKLAKLVKAPLQILKATKQAANYIKQWQPDVVLGMGGYVSGPGGLAAWINRVPVVLHEQNAVAGLTNRLLSQIAKIKLQAFPGAFLKAEVVGNPIREELLELPEPQELADNQPLNILVMGGSQGAKVLNDVVPQALAKLNKNIAVVHQTGKGKLDVVEQRYKDVKFEYIATEFIDNIAAAYQKADLVICRSGALTVSEIAAAGVAAIFVPFMHADAQQAKNAQHLVAAKAAIIIEQQDFNQESLQAVLVGLDNNKIYNMAVNARKQAKLDAADKVANAIISLVTKNS